jgi:hypothetical protein
VPARGKLPFDAKTVGEEIEAERVRLGISVEDAVKTAGLSSRTHWYTKTDGTKPFRWEEVARLAAGFHAPKGWPLLTIREAEAAEQAPATIETLRATIDTLNATIAELNSKLERH